jgi:phosphoribosylcarboxyaminoimidazole (NCAIR) mutase
VALEPAGAALLAAKILALGDAELRARVQAAQRAQTEVVIAADMKVVGRK